MQDDADAKTKNILSGAVGVRELNDHVLILPAQGNALAVKMADGIVLVDSGSGRGMTARMIQYLRDWSDLQRWCRRLAATCFGARRSGT